MVRKMKEKNRIWIDLFVPIEVYSPFLQDAAVSNHEVTKTNPVAVAEGC